MPELADQPTEPADQPPELPRLSDEEISSRFNQWIDQWPGAGRCPICSQFDWGDPGTGQVYNYGRGVLGGGGSHYMLIVRVCNICGFVQMFNGAAMGFQPSQLDRSRGEDG